MKLSPKHELTLVISVGIILLLLAIFEESLSGVFSVLRAVLGIPFLLLLPGYWLQSAIYPKRGMLDAGERWAVSFGLSIAIIPPVVLVFDLLLHIPLNSVSIFMGEGIVLGLLGGFSFLRRRTIDQEERFVIVVHFHSRLWWRNQPSFDRLLVSIFITVMIIALFTVGIMLWLINRPPPLTEFFLLDAKNLAEAYPTSMIAGETISLNIGVTNREHRIMYYSILVQQESEILAEIAPFELSPDETIIYPIAFSPILSEGHARVEFFLFQEGENAPYRSLLLQLTGGG